MAKRKTIDVKFLKEKINFILRTSDKTQRSMRQEMLFLMETVLFETGNYNGFKYLTQHQITDGAPGIFIQPDGTYVEDTCFEMTDTTRVEYI